MSVDGARDLNVFFSSPRVGFGETPPATTTSSLLTFADMVLALDRQNICESVEFRSSVVDANAGNDHTYASSGYSRTTRSQTAKAAVQFTSRFLEQEEKWKTKDVVNEVVFSGANLDTRDVSSKYSHPVCEFDSPYLKDKRSSSVDKMNNAGAESPVVVCKTCEWPDSLCKNSPRKSSSFEEVCCDNNKSSLKSSKSSEHVQKTGVSHTLHRFVNNTLEFPCWPRKADHTYATATWDGTAASHSLFEQELRQDSTRQNIIEDQEMEDTEHEYTQPSQPDQISVTSANQIHNFSILTQKDDHTYVRSKVLSLNSAGNFDIDELNIVTETDTQRRQAFSSATFPRQKLRDDHTYFHSGLSRKYSSGPGRREWASTQTVATSSAPQDLEIEEGYKNLNSVSQSASNNRDHNYSTSA